MEKLQQARLIWLAQTLAIFVFGVVGAVARPPDADDGGLGLILVGVALLIALAQPVLTRVLATAGDPFTWYVIRFAIAESIAIFGLVIVMLGGSLVYLGVLCFVALASMALLMPSESGVERYRRYRGERPG